MESNGSLPQYYDLLSDGDRADYAELRLLLSEPEHKNRRNRSVETFAEIIARIKNFVMQNDSDDWKRGVVCGLFWFQPEDTLALNTRQLRLLIAKCKSSINGSFQQLGYGMGIVGTDCGAVIVKYLPILTGNFQELRQWTIRQKLIAQPVFVSPPPDLAIGDTDKLLEGLELGLPRCFAPEFDPLDLACKMNLRVFDDEPTLKIGDGLHWEDIEPGAVHRDRELDFTDMLL
jgi:hypothetical protein